MAEEGEAGFGKVQFGIDTAPGPLFDFRGHKSREYIGHQEHEQEGNTNGNTTQFEEFNGYPFEGE